MLTMGGESGAMNKAALLAASLALLIPAGAFAAERNFSVTGFDRIRVDGPYRVTLTTGVSPFAKATGPTAAINSVSLDVQGRTLIIRPHRSSWGGYPGEPTGPVGIEVGTHDLNTAWINGAGSLAIDRVKGLSFDLALQGAGSAEIGNAAVDQMKIGISGAASAKVAGTVPKLTAIVRGASTLDARDLKTKDATIGAEGPAVVAVTVTNSAEVDAKGTSTVQLSGAPACTVRAFGSAVVSGCGSAQKR